MYCMANFEATVVLYHHFPSEEKLYIEMITAYLARLRQAAIEAAPSKCAVVGGTSN